MDDTHATSVQKWSQSTPDVSTAILHLVMSFGAGVCAVVTEPAAELWPTHTPICIWWVILWTHLLVMKIKD